MNRLMELERSFPASANGAAKKKQHAVVTKAMSRRKRRRQLSEGLYDTGEHILAGEGLADLPHFQVSILPQAGRPFHIGRPSGSGQRQQFSYGDIIACGDFYEDFQAMNAAPHGQLQSLHRMLRQAERYYLPKVAANRTGGTHPDINWSSVIIEYGMLALKNFTHFAPSNRALISPTRIGAGGARAGNHKDAWYRFHMLAAAEVRRNPDSEGIHTALAINAFGDHFLTDAFAAGHLFNKNDLTAAFNAQAYSGNSLNSKGERLVAQVADRAFKGKLREAFSEYDFLGRNHQGGGLSGRNTGGRFNIRTATQFRWFLEGVANTRTYRNLLGDSIVAKALHDELNEWDGGMPVRNETDPPWNLTGDSSMNRENRDKARQAVSQSIYNIVHEVGAGVADRNLTSLVWRYAPQPTDGSIRAIAAQARIYANPASPQLVSRAVKILGREYQTLLEMAKGAGELRHDP